MTYGLIFKVFNDSRLSYLLLSEINCKNVLKLWKENQKLNVN